MKERKVSLIYKGEVVRYFKGFRNVKYLLKDWGKTIPEHKFKDCRIVFEKVLSTNKSLIQKELFS